MVFVFDLDDTVCDSNGYSEKYINDFFKKHDLPYKQVKSVTRFAEKKFDWDDEIALAWYLKYGDQMMSEFPVKNNAVEIINKLHDMGHRIVIATARSDDWHNEPVRITVEWLIRNGVEYDQLYIGETDKDAICMLEKADVFVDDDLKHCANVVKTYSDAKKKCHVFLANTDYNLTQTTPDNVRRINSLNEMLEILKIQENQK